MLGTVCHSAAEDALTSVIDVAEGHSDAPMSLEDTMDAFTYYWEDAIPTIQVWNNYNPDSALAAGLDKVTNWYNEVFPQVTPVQVEHTFNVPSSKTMNVSSG